MDITAIILLFLSVAVSTLVVLWINPNQKWVNNMLYFSGAFLLAMAFTQIIPEIFSGEHKTYLGLFVLTGFFIQVAIEYLSGGVDHGHHHADSHDHHTITPWALLVGISLHAFFEGMPFSGHFSEHEHAGDLLLWGILIHKVPIAIVLVSLFMGAGYSRTKTIIFLLIFALAAPLGSLMSHIGGYFIHDVERYYEVIMALVVGIFFHIATVILYEGDKSHTFNLKKFITVVLGISVALAVSVLH
jgi:zinc transporter ZupT